MLTGCLKPPTLPVGSLGRAALDGGKVHKLIWMVAYYLPRDSIANGFKLAQIPDKASLCEWKGRATYCECAPELAADIAQKSPGQVTNNSTGEIVKNKIWSYEAPTPAFKEIKGYLSMYANGVPWECFVDDEKVTPQEGEPLPLQSDQDMTLEVLT
jgi:uncharacterized protein (DUF427 family)